MYTELIQDGHVYVRSDGTPTGNSYFWRYKELEDILGITVTGTGNDTISNSKTFYAQIKNGIC